MEIIVYILLSFALLRMLIAMLNFISNPYLKSFEALNDKPLVSILIPVRNEESNIGNLLDDISNLTYTDYECLVFNDNSEDNTEKILSKYCEKNLKIRLIQGISLPDGWLGKNHACHQLSESANGDYFLFLDADVRTEKDMIEKMVATIQKSNIELLSIFPKQIMKTKGEHKVVPIMNQILLSLLPLFLVKASKMKSLSAANGQFMCFSAEVYHKLKPHKVFKRSAVEDIGIIRYYKKKRYKCKTLLGNKDVSCRMYHSKEEAVQGFLKNVLDFFSNSILFTSVYLLFTNFSLIYLIVFNLYYYGLLYIIIILITKVSISAVSKQNIMKNLLYIFHHQYILNYLVFRSILQRKKKSLYWKGRNIYK